MAKKLAEGTDLHERATLNDANSPTVASIWPCVVNSRERVPPPTARGAYEACSYEDPQLQGTGGAQSGTGASRGFSDKLVGAFSAGTVAEAAFFLLLARPAKVSNSSEMLFRRAVQAARPFMRVQRPMFSPQMRLQLGSRRTQTRLSSSGSSPTVRRSRPSWPRSPVSPWKANLPIAHDTKRPMQYANLFFYY